MYNGWTNAAFAATAPATAVDSSFTAMELGGGQLSGYTGSAHISTKALDIRKVVVELSQLVGAPFVPAQVEVILTWDEDGDHCVLDEPLTGTVQVGLTNTTKATAVIPVASGGGLTVPPRGLYTKTDSAYGVSRGARMWAWVKLDAGSATAVVRVVNLNGGT